VAKAGDGTCILIMNTNEIRGKVIEALRKATDLCWNDCSLEWVNLDKAYSYPCKSDLGMLFRNDSVQALATVSKSNLEKVSLVFKGASKHAGLEAQYNYEFSANQFKEYPKGETIF